MEETQYGLPLIVGKLTETAALGLKRIRFEKGSDDGYNERWLQKLVSHYPNVLPIEQLEPALTPAVSICMELPLASGFVDNLFATPDGAVATVERIDMTEDEQIVAICRRGRLRQAIPNLDLPLPDPRPGGAEWIEAYRHWAVPE